MIFVQLALRNVRRNARRSAITILAIGVGMAALLFLWAFLDGVNDQMIENSTRYLSGHLQVHRSGYHEEQKLELSLPNAALVTQRLREADGVEAVSPRLEGSALASVDDQSRGVVVLGVDPAQEPQVTTLAKTITQGRALQAGERDGVVIGERVAQALGASVGSELVLVTQAADGSVGAGRYRVQGIFNTRMDMLDGVYVLLPLAAAQELYATGDAITTVVARVEDRGQVKALTTELKSALGPGYEVLGWDELLPAVVQSVAFHEVTGYVLLLVLFVVVAVGITNTVLMAVMERTREFGVMMALGTAQSQLTRQVFYEACILAAGGVLLGTVAGMAVIGYYASRGMDFSRYVRAMETMQGLTSFIYPLPRLDRGLFIAVLVFAIGVISALYPAWRTARLVPVAAIRGLPAGGSARLLRGEPGPPKRPMLRLPLLFKIAARGIGRNPYRTALTVAASAFGVAAFVFVIGLSDGYLADLVRNSTGYVTGHLQVQHPRFRTEMEATNSLENGDALVQRVRALPQVAAATARVQTLALGTSAGQSRNFMLIGIDPAAESQVTFMHQAVRSGRMLGADAAREIVLGERLAEKLGLRLGEKLVVMAQAADGSVGSAAYRVVGLFDTGSDAFDAMLGYVTLPAAQSLLALEGKVSTVAIRLKTPDRLEEAQAALQAVLPVGAVAVSWRELLPEVDQMIEYLRVMLGLITAIILAVVAIGVMNTLLMSVMERTREFGIMMALGSRPRAIVMLVIYESLVLGLVGIAAGLALGIPVVQYLGVRGLDLSAYSRDLQSIPGLTGMVYPRFVAAHLLRPSLILLAMSMLAALYPALRAARLEPAKAIRHV